MPVEYEAILQGFGRWLVWLVQHLSTSASDLALTALLVPILLAFLSRQLIAILGTVLLAIVLLAIPFLVLGAILFLMVGVFIAG